jgi:cyclic pyranopterin phosphate synthase
MPKDVFDREYEFLPHADLLTFEEIERLTRILVDRGVRKVRLTGGEPLLRRGIEDLVARLAQIDGVADLTMTTNGTLLGRKAGALAGAGLRRITVSLDSVDDETFRAMNDVDFPVSRVLEGIDAAAAVGLAPVKVNVVVKRGGNDDAIEEIAARFRGTEHIVRFIEYMDVGASNNWRMGDVMTATEILERIGARWPLEAVQPSYRGEVANRWRYRDGGGEIGVIASVTAPFCGDCTRLRLSAEGRLYTCLFATSGTDIRGPMRDGATDDDLAAIVGDLWERRDDRYSERRTEVSLGLPKVEMSYIGG